TRPFLDEVGAPPGRLRIALVTEAPDGPPVHADCVAAATSAARLCESLGHVVEPATAPLDLAAFHGALRVIICANLRHTLDLRGRMRGRRVGPDEVERVTWAMAEEGKSRGASEYAAAIQTVHGIGRKMAGFFATYDLLLTPTLAQPPVPLGTLDMMLDDIE